VTVPEYHERVVVKTALEQDRFEVTREIPTVRNVEKVVGLPQEVVQVVEIPGAERIVTLQN
jgi:hypothetical protein